MTKPTIHAAAFALLAFVSTAARADVYYADCVHGDDAYDGKAAVWDGAHGPKFRIQAAVDLADRGDTVIVAPGVYGDAQGVNAGGTVDDVDYNAVRVLVKKPITLKSSGGKAVTHIVGKWTNPDNWNAVGAGGVSGVFIAKSAGPGTEIEGFTIRDCGRESKNPNLATAVIYGYQQKMSSLTIAEQPEVDQLPFVVDCTISNCTSRIGSIQMVNGVRLFVVRNYCTDTPGAVERCNLLYSVVSQNGFLAGNCHPIRSGRYLVNCTITDNAGSNLMSNNHPGEMYNCLQSDSRGNIYSTVVSNSYYIGDLKGTVAGENVKGSNYGQLMAPLFDDFRLVASNGLCSVSKGQAIGLAREEWLKFFPEKYRHTDFLGAEVVPVDGRLNAGAVQETATPVAGFYIPTGCHSTNVTVNGVIPRDDSGTMHTVLTDKWPVWYEFAPAGNTDRELHGFGVDEANGIYRYPDSRGKALFVPRKGSFTKLTVRWPSATLYVDPVNGDDANDGGKDAPKRTLKGAHDLLNDSGSTFALIHLAPGSYAEGGSSTGSGDTQCNHRLVANKAKAHVCIVGDEGAERTFIVGARDPDSADGCGPKAWKCIRAGHDSSTGGSFCVRGVTLTGGATAVYDNQNSSYGTGPALCAMNANAPVYLIECVISNNTGYSSGVARGGILQRCLIKDNTCVKYGLVSPIAESGNAVVSCEVIATNALPNSVIMSPYTCVIGSTLLGPAACSNFLIPRHIGHLFDTIVRHSKEWNKNTARDDSKYRIKGVVFDDYAYTLDKRSNKAGENFIHGDSRFTDEANCDLTFDTASAAVGVDGAWGNLTAPTWSDDSAWSNYYRYVTHDFDGNVPESLLGHRAIAGCHQVPARSAAVVTATRPDCVLSPAGTNALAWGESVTVTASATGTRQVTGLMVNGEFREGATSASFTAPASYDPAQPAAFSVVAVVNTNWYVNAEGGDDSATGWTADTAMRTLTAVMEKAEKGDAVWALPGVYAEGSKVHDEVIYHFTNVVVTPADIKLPSRVVVPAGVRLVSTEGAERTVIKGERAPTADGLGEGAMRAVLLGKGACLDGFTVTGGGTLTGSTAYQYEIFDNVAGGGILCADLPGDTVKGLVENCVVSNNVGCGTSGALYGSYVHCAFYENRGATYALREPSWVYGCVIDRNASSGAVVYQPYNVDFCTFGAANTDLNGKTRSALYSYPNSAKWPVRNSLFLGDKSSTLKWAFNCVGAFEKFIVANNDLNCWENCRWDPTVAVDADWRPAIGCAATDGAVDPMTSATNVFRYATPAALLRDTDFAGGRRVYNGTQDVGAGECDWRGRYGRDIGGKVTVTEAGPATVENADGKVEVRDGALDLVWRNTSGVDLSNATLSFEVKGGGTLTLAIGGETATYTAADGLVSLRRTLAARSETDVRFAYAAAEGDEAGAVIGPFKSNAGMTLIVQ